jgi:hypothetical protein
MEGADTTRKKPEKLSSRCYCIVNSLCVCLGWNPMYNCKPKLLLMNLSTNLERTVSFFTNCYEKDWERVLVENRLETMIKRCNVDFFEKVLIINNVADRNLVEQYAKEAVSKKIIDAYYFSEDYSKEILEAFSVKRKSFMLDFYDGYWYSMGPLSAIYFCKGKYLLYFTCDCMIEERASASWINESIDLFQQDSSILIANPTGYDNKHECKVKNFKQDDKYFYTYGFSDQVFLVENSRVYGDIYNYYHYYTERYPIYAGELFEKRLNSYMCHKKFSRITRKDVYYEHEKLLNNGLESIPANNELKNTIKRMAAVSLKKIRKAVLKRILGHTKTVAA